MGRTYSWLCFSGLFSRGPAAFCPGEDGDSDFDWSRSHVRVEFGNVHEVDGGGVVYGFETPAGVEMPYGLASVVCVRDGNVDLTGRIGATGRLVRGEE